MKYIWRKRAGARRLRNHGEELTQRFGGALALVERPGSKRALLEISCRTKQQANELIHELAGASRSCGWTGFSVLPNKPSETIAHRLAPRHFKRTGAAERRRADRAHSGGSRVWNGPSRHDRHVFALARTCHAPSHSRLEHARRGNGQRHSRHRRRLLRSRTRARGRERSPRLPDGEAERARQRRPPDRNYDRRHPEAEVDRKIRHHHRQSFQRPFIRRLAELGGASRPWTAACSSPVCCGHRKPRWFAHCAGRMHGPGNPPPREMGGSLV